jgi:hypothetical protein
MQQMEVALERRQQKLELFFASFFFKAGGKTRASPTCAGASPRRLA